MGGSRVAQHEWMLDVVRPENPSSHLISLLRLLAILWRVWFIRQLDGVGAGPGEAMMQWLGVAGRKGWKVKVLRAEG